MVVIFMQVSLSKQYQESTEFQIPLKDCYKKFIKNNKGILISILRETCVNYYNNYLNVSSCTVICTKNAVKIIQAWILTASSKRH